MAKKTSKKTTKRTSKKKCDVAPAIGGRPVSKTKTIVNPGVNNQI